VADTGVSVVNKRIAIVSGDVRVTDGVVSAQAGGDTIVSARVDVGDAVVMNTGRGGTTTVGVVSGSVVPPVIDLLVVMLVLFLLMRVGILVVLCVLTEML